MRGGDHWVPPGRGHRPGACRHGSDAGSGPEGQGHRAGASPTAVPSAGGRLQRDAPGARLRDARRLAGVIEAFLKGLGAGYGIAIPVGAVAVLIVEAGLRRGFLVAEAAGLGAASADGVYATVAAGFGAALADLLVPIARPLRAVAVVVLVGIAARGLVGIVRERARASRSTADGVPSPDPGGATGPSGERVAPVHAPRSARRTYVAFLAITLANPMTVVYFAALIIGLQATGTGPAEKAAFVAGAFAASLSWQTVLAVAGAVLHHRLGGGIRAAVSLAGNLIVLAFAASIALGLAGG